MLSGTGSIVVPPPPSAQVFENADSSAGAGRGGSLSATSLSSAGVQAGIQRRDLLIIFKTPAALAHFVDKGWEFGAGGAVGAGAGSKGNVGGGSGEQFVNDALFYSLTDKGVEVGAGFQGTKFWKDKDLN
jgi:lipid-binding SYLF domain-containing protein